MDICYSDDNKLSYLLDCLNDTTTQALVRVIKATTPPWRTDLTEGDLPASS